LLKDLLMQQPGKTRSTRLVDPWPGRTRTRPGDIFFFLFKCGFCIDLGRRRRGSRGWLREGWGKLWPGKSTVLVLGMPLILLPILPQTLESRVQELILCQ
jgi:hypothetical protein